MNETEILALEADQYGVDFSSAEYSYQVFETDTIEVNVEGADDGD